MSECSNELKRDYSGFVSSRKGALRDAYRELMISALI